MKNSISVHLQKDEETNRWAVSLPTPNKPTGFMNAYTTTVFGPQSEQLKDGIDGDGILQASCKYQNHKTNKLIDLEVY